MTDTKSSDLLDDVRVHNERLGEEIRTKTDLCNKLKKVQDDLITKLQEAKQQSEKQTQELTAKSEELSTISQLYQDLKSSFQERESSFKHLNSALEKLRYEYGEKLQKLEGENKDLILSLDESTTTSQCLKSKLDSSNMEIEDLKRIILLKDKKLVEVSDKARATKDLIQRDDVISKLEGKHRDVQDKLKWKNEQFQHLEEAHERLQDNFKSCKVEWEKEKSLLLEEICSVQTSLDSQTRISENLQTQLRICNQALAHEESNKKLLEVEVSEYKSRLEDIYSECHEAKATLEKLSHKRDEEVAELRDSLAAKDSIANEIGYKMAHLEQENKDLIASLKDLQEAQISNYGNTGLLKKLQKKYHGLEQVHKKCVQNLKEKEVEWTFELEKVRKEMEKYLSELKVQSERAKQLQKELESGHCLSEVQNKEMFSLVPVLKSQFSETYMKLELQNKEKEETIQHQKEQLVMKNNALSEVNLNLDKKSEEVALMIEKVKSFDDMKQHQLLIEEQIQVLESSRSQDVKNDSEALSQKFEELEKQKLVAESQIMQLETNLEEYKTENQTLLSKANEQNNKIAELQQQLVLLETLVTERKEAIKAQKNLLVVSVQEKTSLLQVIEEKNQRIEELVEEFKALENKATDALMIYEEKQIEIIVIHQALLKLKNEGLSYKFVELEKEKLLAESQIMRLETENQILLSKANEQNEKNVDLQKELVLLETLVTERNGTIGAHIQDKEAYLKIIEDKENSITSLLRIIEEGKQRIEELMEEFKALENKATDALMIYEEKQIEIIVIHQALLKLKNEGLSYKFVELEKEKLLAESQIMRLETENRILLSKANEQNEKNVDLQKELVLLETLVTERNGTIEAHIQDKEAYLKIIEDKENSITRLLRIIEEGKQRIEELMEEFKALENKATDALMIYEEKQIEIIVIHQALLKLKNEGLSYKFVELEKEKLLAESQIMRLETENRILLSKANEQNEKNVDLQKELVLLETLVTERNGTIEAHIQDKEAYLKIIEDKENSITSLLRIIEEGKQRIEELMEESKALEKDMINALMATEEKQMEIHVLHQALYKLENEISDLFEKIKVKDESLLQSSQQVEELETLLKINKVDTDNMKEQYGKVVKEMTNALVISEQRQIEIDVKREALHKLENEVSSLHEKLRIKNESLIKSSQHAKELESLLLLRRDDFLIQMEITSKQMEEYSNKDVELMGMLENMLHKSDAKEGVVRLPFSPLLI